MTIAQQTRGIFVPMMSLLLCLCSCVLWVRSRTHADIFDLRSSLGFGVEAYSEASYLELSFEQSTGWGNTWHFNSRGSPSSRIRQPDGWLVGEPSMEWVDDFRTGAFGLVASKRHRDDATFPNQMEHLWACTIHYGWLVLTTALIPLALLFRVARGWKRKRGGLCPFCGYDLRASPNRCPECGKLFNALTAE